MAAFSRFMPMNPTLLSIANRIVHILPSTRFYAFKRFLFRLSGVKIGKNVRICSSAIILGKSVLSIADNVWIGHETMILASAPITIGSNVNIAPRCYIGTGTHEIDLLGASIAGKGKSLPIIIKDGAWLCTHSVIIAGTTIGKQSIIAAGAVVTNKIPDRELWGGIPARFIKKLDANS